MRAGVCAGGRGLGEAWYACGGGGCRAPPEPPRRRTEHGTEGTRAWRRRRRTRRRGRTSGKEHVQTRAALELTSLRGRTYGGVRSAVSGPLTPGVPLSLSLFLPISPTLSASHAFLCWRIRSAATPWHGEQRGTHGEGCFVGCRLVPLRVGRTGEREAGTAFPISDDPFSSTLCLLQFGLSLLPPTDWRMCFTLSLKCKETQRESENTGMS